MSTARVRKTLCCRRCHRKFVKLKLVNQKFVKLKFSNRKFVNKKLLKVDPPTPENNFNNDAIHLSSGKQKKISNSLSVNGMTPAKSHKDLSTLSATD